MIMGKGVREILVTAIYVAIGAGAQSAETEVNIGELLRMAGSYSLRGSTATIELKVQPLGGFLSLHAGNRRRGEPRALIGKDVTGVAWVDRHRIAYTTSPVYGEPGVFLFCFPTGRSVRLVDPKTRNPGYPDGADYFELVSVEFKPRAQLLFYYAPDVDKTDFATFREGGLNLYEVLLDGSGFGRHAPSPPVR